VAVTTGFFTVGGMAGEARMVAAWMDREVVGGCGAGEDDEEEAEAEEAEEA
jgi:hypothetical protein